MAGCIFWTTEWRRCDLRVNEYTGLVRLGQPHPGMNERSSRLDDDRDLIVVAVAEPVEWHVRVRRPSGYLALRTLTHATSTRARANDVRHIMFGTLLRPNVQRYLTFNDE